MGDFFEIDEETKAYARGVFDDMLEAGNYGKPCTLSFQTTETICPNCIINPKTGESTNRYKVGGPVPFVSGEICPVCEGRGRIGGSGTYTVIYMSIDWLPKPWMNIGSGTGSEADRLIRVPSGMVTTRGFMTDLPAVLRCSYAILDIDNPYVTNSYKLYGEPYSVGSVVRNRYFYAVWERAG